MFKKIRNDKAAKTGRTTRITKNQAQKFLARVPEQNVFWYSDGNVFRDIMELRTGVELGGVSVYLSEMATPGHKGFYASWQSASQQVSIVVAAALGYASPCCRPRPNRRLGLARPLFRRWLSCRCSSTSANLLETERIQGQAQAPTPDPRNSSSRSPSTGGRGRGHVAGGDDHRDVLPDHGLYPHLRHEVLKLECTPHPDRHLLRRPSSNFILLPYRRRSGPVGRVPS